MHHRSVDQVNSKLGCRVLLDSLNGSFCCRHSSLGLKQALLAVASGGKVSITAVAAGAAAASAVLWHLALPLGAPASVWCCHSSEETVLVHEGSARLLQLPLCKPVHTMPNVCFCLTHLLK